MKIFQTFLVFVFFVAAAAAAFGASIKSDYRKDFDFRQLRTFAFKMDRSGNDPLAVNSDEADRIQNALATQLESNGFTPATDRPDFMVAFYARTKKRTVVEVGPSYYGPELGWIYENPDRGRWHWGYAPEVWTKTYGHGWVIADVIGVKTNEVVWRGAVKQKLHGIGQSDKQLDDAAKDLVKRFLKDTRGRKTRQDTAVHRSFLEEL